MVMMPDQCPDTLDRFSIHSKDGQKCMQQVRKIGPLAMCSFFLHLSGEACDEALSYNFLHTGVQVYAAGAPPVPCMMRVHSGLALETRYMREAVNVIKNLLDECSEQDRSAWQSRTQSILGAIRASHPTRHGVRTAIAAAFFENAVLPRIMNDGWQRPMGMPRHDPFSVVIEKDKTKARILIAALELRGGKSRRGLSQGDRADPYVVRLGKRQARRHRGSESDSDRDFDNRPQGPSRTRAWSFDEFDILAVNTQTATREWTDFRFALSRTLLPNKDHPVLIATAQPVSLGRSTNWMGELGTCLNHLLQS